MLVLNFSESSNKTKKRMKLKQHYSRENLSTCLWTPLFTLSKNLSTGKPMSQIYLQTLYNLIIQNHLSLSFVFTDIVFLFNILTPF